MLGVGLKVFLIIPSKVVNNMVKSTALEPPCWCSNSHSATYWLCDPVPQFLQLQNGDKNISTSKDLRIWELSELNR